MSIIHSLPNPKWPKPSREGANNMQELTFEVIEISTERRIDGNTTMRLMCIQDEVVVDIEIKNSQRDDRYIIRQRAIDEHCKCLESKKINKVDVGSII